VDCKSTEREKIEIMRLEWKGPSGFLSLSRRTILPTINLGGNCIGSEGAKWISDMIKKMIL
jgi:hypothetical protein